MKLATAAMALVVCLPSPGVGQVASASLDDLRRAETRVREGRIREARTEVERWWLLTDGSAAPEVLQNALWLRGILTVDPSQADRDFRRIVLEFPNGSRAAPARLRLGQSAHARDDLEAALRHFRALDRDFPGTRFRIIAQSWLDRYEAAAEALIRARGWS